MTAPLRNQYLNDRLANVGGVARVVAGAAASGLDAVVLLGWAGVVIAPLAALVWSATSPVRTASTDGRTTGRGTAAPTD